MFRTLDDLPAELSGQRVLVRGDLNVPMAGGQVGDATRLRALAPTIEALAARGAAIILLSHFGRPKGRDTSQSLAPVAAALGEVLGRPVGFIADCAGPEAEAAAAALPPGSVTVVENTRFHAGEEANDPAFAAAMARLGHIFVNDAFSVAHRAHASTEGLAHLLPAYAGRSMEAELSALEAALGAPKRPVAAVVGGAKVSSKLAVLKNLAAKVDHLMIGGGMANTFLAAKGIAIGRSLAERDMLDEARAVLAAAEAAGSTVHLPWDAVLATEFRADPPTRIASVGDVGEDEMILDVGPASVENLADTLKVCATLVWNGPLGAFETPPFGAGTVALARTAAALTDAGALVSVAGGGDTVAALAMAGATDRFSFVSTAGGAFLEWMEGRPLPGVEALRA
jgi:phosphoglycerate kinase